MDHQNCWPPKSWFPPEAENRRERQRESAGMATLRSFWKSRFWYRYRPEGIYRKKFGLILHPPGTYVSTAKKGKFIGTGHFSIFPRCVAFLEIGGDWYWYTVFFSLSLEIKLKQIMFDQILFMASPSCGCSFWIHGQSCLLCTDHSTQHVRLQSLSHVMCADF